MTFRLNACLRVFALVLPVSALSCAALDDYDRSAELGAIGLNLTLPGDMQSEDLDYTITSQGSFQKSGKIPFGLETRSFSATISGIPLGTGYQLQLSAGADTSKVRCMGSAGFDILKAQVTSRIGVKLQCHVDKDHGPGPGPEPDEDAGTGGVDIGGDINLCPEIDDVYTWREANGTFELSSSACDPDSAPAALRYQWSASAGKLSSTDDEVVHFVCPESGGVVQVSLQVSDSLCPEKAVAEIDCDCDDDKKGVDEQHGKRRP